MRTIKDTVWRKLCASVNLSLWFATHLKYNTIIGTYNRHIIITFIFVLCVIFKSFLILELTFFSSTLSEEYWAHEVWRQNNWNWRPDARLWFEERVRCVIRKRYVRKLNVKFCIDYSCLTLCINIIYLLTPLSGIFRTES